MWFALAAVPLIVAVDVLAGEGIPAKVTGNKEISYSTVPRAHNNEYCRGTWCKWIFLIRVRNGSKLELLQKGKGLFIIGHPA
jgi:hypothetical protein